MKTGIMIKKSSFAYVMILTPGVFTVKAGSFNKILDTNLGKEKYIVNLKAIIGKENADKVRELYKGSDETDLGNLNGLTASANIIINEGKNPDVPMKNQNVRINVEYIVTKEGKKMLAVTSILVPPAASASAFSFDDEESSEEITDQSLSATGEKPEVAKTTVKEEVKSF
jgi:hypothetical protein